MGEHGVPRMSKYGVPRMGEHGVLRMGEHGVPWMGEHGREWVSTEYLGSVEYCKRGVRVPTRGWRGAGVGQTCSVSR